MFRERFRGRLRERFREGFGHSFILHSYARACVRACATGIWEVETKKTDFSKKVCTKFREITCAGALETARCTQSAHSHICNVCLIPDVAVFPHRYY